MAFHGDAASSQPSPETFEPRWRNHLETQGWQETSINLGLGTGCGPAFVQSLLIGSCAVPMLLKPLIGFTTSTSPFDRPDHLRLGELLWWCSATSVERALPCDHGPFIPIGHHG